MACLAFTGTLCHRRYGQPGIDPPVARKQALAVGNAHIGFPASQISSYLSNFRRYRFGGLIYLAQQPGLARSLHIHGHLTDGMAIQGNGLDQANLAHHPFPAHGIRRLLRGGFQSGKRCIVGMHIDAVQTPVYANTGAMAADRRRIIDVTIDERHRAAAAILPK